MLLVMALLVALPASARAQNDGKISFSSGIDVLPGSTYIWRGISQEADAKVTMWPWWEAGLSAYEGDGAISSFDIAFGGWHSLHTGSSGSDGPSGQLHYEEDFYAGFSLGLPAATSLGVTWTAYTSPNGSFETWHEVAFNFSVDNMYAPYVTIGQFVNEGQSGTLPKATYMELGVGPSWDFADGAVNVAVPVFIGLSLNDFYLDPNSGDNAVFGYFDVGLGLTVPIAGLPESFGAWDFHANVDLQVYGDSLEAFNGDSTDVTGALGVSFSY
jgi:hypothetical protein